MQKFALQSRQISSRLPAIGGKKNLIWECEGFLKNGTEHEHQQRIALGSHRFCKTDVCRDQTIEKRLICRCLRQLQPCRLRFFLQRNLVREKIGAQTKQYKKNELGKATQGITVPPLKR